MNEPQEDASQPDAIELEVGPAGHGERRRFRPGGGRSEWFRDIDIGPEMVVVPAGSFVMGAGEDEGGYGYEAETPAHRVTIARPFAVGRFAVTFDEWDAVVARRALSYLPSDKGWGRGRRPVINLSWFDAQAYVAWLATATGHPYRLLSEAEWEYAARAGTRTRYWWGDGFSPGQGNFVESGRSLGRAEREALRTVEVDRFEANPWGLYQVHGNVWEWCADPTLSKHRGYRGAPGDSSVWQNGETRHRVLRGGAYGSSEYAARAAKRRRNRADTRSGGLRVARTLTP